MGFGRLPLFPTRFLGSPVCQTYSMRSAGFFETPNLWFGYRFPFPLLVWRSRFQRNYPPSLSSFQIKNKEICWAFNAAFIIWHPYVVSPPTQFINTLFELFRANLSSWFDVVLFWCYPIVFVLVLCASRIEFSVAWSLVEWLMKFYTLDLYLFIDIFFTKEPIFIYHRVLKSWMNHSSRKIGISFYWKAWLCLKTLCLVYLVFFFPS